MLQIAIFTRFTDFIHICSFHLSPLDLNNVFRVILYILDPRTTTCRQYIRKSFLESPFSDKGSNFNTSFKVLVTDLYEKKNERKVAQYFNLDLDLGRKEVLVDQL